MKIPLKTNTYDINGLNFGALVAFIKGVRGPRLNPLRSFSSKNLTGQAGIWGQGLGVKDRVRVRGLEVRSFWAQRRQPVFLTT